MYRFFIDSNVSVIDRIDELREKYPHHHFKDGKRKGVRGIWVLLDPSWKEPYGEPKEIEGFGQFQSSQVKQSVDLSPWEIPSQDKAPLTLQNGIKIRINSGVVAPKQVFLFSQPQRVKPKDGYGIACFNLSSRIEEGEEVRLDDEDFLEVVKMALLNSYSFVPPFWDRIGISVDDMDKIVIGALGGDPDWAKKENASNAS